MLQSITYLYITWILSSTLLWATEEGLLIWSLFFLHLFFYNPKIKICCTIQYETSVRNLETPQLQYINGPIVKSFKTWPMPMHAKPYIKCFLSKLCIRVIILNWTIPQTNSVRLLIGV